MRRFGTCSAVVGLLVAGCGGSSVAAPACDGSKSPAEDACVVTEALGVFVSSGSGSASGDGSRSKPLATLSAGIAAAKGSGKRVYACAETYAEALILENGVSVFGSLACESAWKPVTRHATVHSPSSPAARSQGITVVTRVEGIDLTAPDAVASGASSIALVADGSPGLRFHLCTFHGGQGAAGAAGASGVQLVDSPTGKAGSDGTTAGTCSGPTTPICEGWHDAQPGGLNSCSGEVGHDPGPGGSGGSGGRFSAPQLVFTWTAFTPATGRGLPESATAATAVGGLYGSSLPMAGADGSHGPDGVSGGPVGVLSAAGYATANGTVGSAGAPGQGGGGGTGVGLQQLQADFGSRYAPGASGFTNTADAWGAPGGGGGAGGCPGLSSQAGVGGGASIAIVAVASPFVLDSVVIETSSGGAGGAAGVPSMPTLGGAGGAAFDAAQGGAAGGAGGLAGVSGNGGGGPSIGVASQGTPPQILTSTVHLGAGGAGVPVRTLGSYVIPASSSGSTVQNLPF
jgi:hypothetical protein